jgi:hypothetical protein
MTADWNGYRQQLVETIVKIAQLPVMLFSRPFLINALPECFFNRPTMCPAWRVRSNGGPGLESKGSSLRIPTSASLLRQFLLCGATIPNWVVRPMG